MEANRKELVDILVSIDNVEDMTKFIEELLTPNERRDVILRWRLLKMINQHIPQRQIASDLGISLCKITRGSKILKDKDSACYKFLNQTDKV